MPPLPTAEIYDPIQNIGRALADAAAQMARGIDRGAQALGISGAQWVVLIRIGDGIGGTASELCRAMSYDSGSMTRMLDRLVKRGFVQRSPSPEDGRAVRLSLTPAGQALHPQLRPIAIAVLGEHLKGFSAEETALFMNFLERVIANGQAAELSGP